MSSGILSVWHINTQACKSSTRSFENGSLPLKFIKNDCVQIVLTRIDQPSYDHHAWLSIEWSRLQSWWKMAKWPNKLPNSVSNLLSKVYILASSKTRWQNNQRTKSKETCMLQPRTHEFLRQIQFPMLQFFSVCVKKLFVIVADGLCQRTTSFVKEFLSHVQSSL